MAALFVGKDRLFGPSYASVNGMECKTVQTVNIKKNGTFWIRKFVRTEGGDGTERVKTALRVAQAIYEKEKPDLVQVSVLDQNGPDLRSNMRGRAIAAQAVYIADVKKLPDDTGAQSYSAFYYDGDPNAEGMFYGLRIDLPLEDAEQLTASLTDFTDCADPASELPAKAHGGGEKAEGHEAAAPSHGGEESAHPPVTEPATPVRPETHGAPIDEQLLTSTPETESPGIFSLAYLKSLFFGKGTVTAEAGQPAEAAVADEPAGQGAPATGKEATPGH